MVYKNFVLSNDDSPDMTNYSCEKHQNKNVTGINNFSDLFHSIRQSQGIYQFLFLSSLTCKQKFFLKIGKFT